MKLAGIQYIISEDIDKNFEKMKNFIKIAVKENAKIIAFPELSLTKWFPAEIDDKNFKFALTKNDKIFYEFSEIARENRVVLIIPFFEKDTKLKLYFNSCILINSDGEIAGIYRKVHLPLIPYWEEKYYFKHGNLGFPVFDTEYGKIGIMLGWDVFFPEVSRILTLNGAEIIIAPTASAFSSQPRWLSVICANALMNTVFIARINRIGNEGKLEFYGGSFCCNPDGSLVSEPSGKGEGLVLWNINLDDLYEIRRLFPFLKDRIEKEYLKICNIEFKTKRKKNVS